MLKVRKKANLMQVYESNYQRLMQLLPGLSEATGVIAIAPEGMPELRVKILEQSKYTTSIALAYLLDIDGDKIPDIKMDVRVYHDARMAEVVSYQNQSGFTNLYRFYYAKFKCPLLRYPFEKRRVNLFLGEWLRYCSLSGYQFSLSSVSSDR